MVNTELDPFWVRGLIRDLWEVKNSSQEVKKDELFRLNEPFQSAPLLFENLHIACRLDSFCGVERPLCDVAGVWWSPLFEDTSPGLATNLPPVTQDVLELCLKGKTTPRDASMVQPKIIGLYLYLPPEMCEAYSIWTGMVSMPSRYQGQPSPLQGRATNVLGFTESFPP